MSINKLNTALKKQFKNHEKQWVDFFITNYAERLIKKGSVEKASLILQCYAFIFNKIEISGVEKLIQDYEIVLKELKAEKNRSKESLQEMLSVLKQSSHLIKENNSEIHSILYGYLDESFSESIKTIKKNIEEDIPQTWLKPLLPNFPSIKGNLTRREQILKQEVTCLEYSKENQQIALGYRNGVIEIRDGKTLDLISTIYDKNGIDGIINLKFTKKNLLAISEDSEYNYFSIWDLKTSKLLGIYNGGADLSTSQIIVFNFEKNAISYDLNKENSFLLWDLEKQEFRVFDANWELIKFELFTKVDKSKSIIVIIYNLDAITLWYFNDGEFQNMEGIFLELMIPENGIIHKQNEVVILWNEKEIKVINIITREVIFSEKLDLKKDKILEVIPTYNMDNYFVITEKFILNINLKTFLFKTLKGINSLEEYSIEYTEEKEFAFVLWQNKMLKFNLIIGKFCGFHYGWNSEDKINIKTGTQLTTINEEGYIENWDIKNNKIIQNQNHIDFVSSIKLFDYETKLLTTSDDKTIKVVDIESPTLTFKILKGHNYEIKDADVFRKKDKEYVASIAGESLFQKKSEIKIWDLEKTKTIKTIKLKTTANVIKVFNKGRYAFTLDDDYCIKIWNLPLGFCIKSIQHNSLDKYIHTPSEKGINEYLKNHLKKGERIEVSPSLFYPSPIVCFSEDDKYAFIAYFDGLLSVFNLKKKRIINNFRGHDMIILSISILNNFILTGSMDSEMKLWDISKGILLKTFTVHKQEVLKVELIEIPYTYNYFTKSFYINKENNKIKYTLSISTNKVLIQTDLNLNKAIRPIELKNDELVYDFKWIPDSELIILIINRTEIRLFNLISSSLISSLNIGRPISKILYIKKERKIIVAETSGQVHFLKIKNEPKETIINSKMF